MFDRVSRLAERTAVGLSRREFLSGLGRVGLGALAFATLVGQAVATGGNNCIYNGGCCPPNMPYYDKKRNACGTDPRCQAIPTQCIPSPKCCGGTGNCIGATCYSSPGCVTPC